MSSMNYIWKVLSMKLNNSGDLIYFFHNYIYSNLIHTLKISIDFISITVCSSTLISKIFYAMKLFQIIF